MQPLEVLSLFFNKVGTLLKKILQHRCFLVYFWKNICNIFYKTPPSNCFWWFNVTQDEPFWGCSRNGWGEGRQKSTLPKIYRRYPVMMKIGTVILYLKTIQKIIYKPGNTLLEFCWDQYFFTVSQELLLYQ